MKRLLIISCSVIVFVFLIYYLKEKYIWPSTPKPTVYLENIDTNWKSSFHISNPNNWEAGDGKVTFVGGRDTIGKLTLYSNEIPSEHKKPGRMMLQVTMTGDFDNINDSVIWGIQFGCKNDLDSEKIILGVNGAGHPIKITGNINIQNINNYIIENCKDVVFGTNRSGERILKGKHFANKSNNYFENCKDDITLRFESKSHFGLTGFHMRRCNKPTGGGGFPTKFIAYNVKKEFSLFVYDPTGNNKIWFKDLKIYNDWLWND